MVAKPVPHLDAKVLLFKSLFLLRLMKISRPWLENLRTFLVLTIFKRTNLVQFEQLSGLASESNRQLDGIHR